MFFSLLSVVFWLCQYFATSSFFLTVSLIYIAISIPFYNTFSVAVFFFSFGLRSLLHFSLALCTPFPAFSSPFLFRFSNYFPPPLLTWIFGQQRIQREALPIHISLSTYTYIDRDTRVPKRYLLWKWYQNDWNSLFVFRWKSRRVEETLEDIHPRPPPPPLTIWTSSFGLYLYEGIVEISFHDTEGGGVAALFLSIYFFGHRYLIFGNTYTLEATTTITFFSSNIYKYIYIYIYS